MVSHLWVSYYFPCSSPVLTKTKAVLEATIFTSNLPNQKVIIEYDSKIVIDAVLGDA